MMVTSLMTKLSTIVRLVLLSSSSATGLFRIITKVISDIENRNIHVDAIYTDNYPLNVSFSKLFSPTQKSLLPKVEHPCDPNRDYILIFDIVHIIKSIRNNWLNLKDNEKVFVFPKVTECEKTSPENEPQSHLRVSIRTSEVYTDSFSISLYPTICYFAFEGIKILYNSDKCNLLKRAPKLASKACWPSSLEKYNVS